MAFDALCDGTTCWQHQDRLPLYIDDNHLSRLRLGLERVYGRFAGALSWVFGQATADRH